MRVLWLRVRPETIPVMTKAPSVAEPEILSPQPYPASSSPDGRVVLSPSVSRLMKVGCFPERHQSAVRLPESFRGGCSFGAGSQAILKTGVPISSADFC